VILVSFCHAIGLALPQHRSGSFSFSSMMRRSESPFGLKG
jgi:hypothetical protein